MERINHIKVVKVGSCGFICQINRVLKRQIPDREGFKFSISCHNSALMLMIKLRKACCKLAASGPRRRYDNKRLCRFDIFVPAVALIADYERNVVRIPRYRVVQINLYAEISELLFKNICTVLSCVLRHHNAADEKSHSAERVNQADNIVIVCNSEVAAHFVFLNIGGIDCDNDFSAFGKVKQHSDFAVGAEARKHTRRVIIVEKLSAKLKVKLAVELLYSFADAVRLHAQVFVIIKSDSVHQNTSE